MADKGTRHAKISAIVLAAGKSSRMDVFKLLLPLGDHTVIGTTVANVLAAAFTETIVVTGHRHADVAASLPVNVQTVHNAAFADGMATSLQAGVNAARSDTDAYLFCLGDMPMVKTTTLLAIARASAGSSAIIVPNHDNRDGNPVLFGSDYRDELLQLTGDAGARRIIGAHTGNVVRIDIDEPGIFQDIDTAVDYKDVLGQ